MPLGDILIQRSTLSECLGIASILPNTSRIQRMVILVGPTVLTKSQRSTRGGVAPPFEEDRQCSGTSNLPGQKGLGTQLEMGEQLRHSGSFTSVGRCRAFSTPGLYYMGFWQQNSIEAKVFRGSCGSLGSLDSCSISVIHTRTGRCSMCRAN